MVDEMGRGYITSGVVGCVIVGAMTLFAAIFTYQQFNKKERQRKMRKVLSDLRKKGE